MTNRRVRKLFYLLLSGTMMLSVLFGGIASAESGETVVQTEAPAPQTEAPAPQTEAPAPQTEAPAPQTEAPAPQTEAPAPQTEAPAPQTEAPAPQTEAPATEAPATEAPQSEAPATEAPANETETPAAESETPASESEAGNEETDAQTESETDKKDKDKDDKKPAFKGSLKVDRQGEGEIIFGDEVTLVVKEVKANKGYTIRWEARDNAQAAWRTVQQGKNSYTFKVDEKNAAYEYRAVMVANKTGEELAAPAYHLPEVHKRAEGETEQKAEEAKTEDTSAQTEGQAQSEQTEEPQSEELGTLDGEAGEETEAAEEVKEPVVAEEKTDDMVDVSSEGSQIVHQEVKKAGDEDQKETCGDAKLDQVKKLEEEEDLPAEETEGEELIVTTLNRSNVRAGADGMSEIFAVAPTDTQFTVLAIEGDWIKVEYEGRIGYIYKTNLDGLDLEEEEKLDEEGNPVEKEKKVTIFSSKWTKTYPGETLRLSSKLEGFEGCEIYYQWTADKGSGFEAIEGANGPEYTFTATEENLSWAWKLQVYYK